MPNAQDKDQHPLDDVRHGFAPDSRRRAEAPDAEPLADIAARLIDDVKATANAEMELLRARAELAGDGMRRAALWGSIAGGFLLVALLILLFGAVLTLAPVVGPVGATLIVGAALVLLAGLAGWLARKGALDIKAAFSERGDDPHWEGDE